MLYIEEYLTVNDICKILKIGKTKAYSLVNQKDFPKIKIGHNIRIPKNKFEEYMSRNTYKTIKL